MKSPAPTVSIVIATLNAERYLDECLRALQLQDYPRDRVEIIVADGGSTDATVEIARRHEVDAILPNKRRTGEAGKAVAIRASHGDLVCTVDSDNIVVGADWLSRMIVPFHDPDVISSEVLHWEYVRSDGYVNRYQALTGINDPMCLWIGNYGRWSRLKDRWTDYPHVSEPRGGWEKVVLHPDFVPTMGANGYIVRRSAFNVVPVGDYFFDIDFVHDLAAAGHRTVARVDVAIRHYFCDGAAQFVRKTRRRADDYFYFAAQGRRSYPWTRRRLGGIARFVGSTILVLPLLIDVARGLRRERDPAWLFHVPACWITLWVYATATLRWRLAPRGTEHDRRDWRQ